MRPPLTRRFALASLALAALLAACGGGGADTDARTEVSSLRVIGDSLADVGTFGLRFTVQRSAEHPNDIYPERVSQMFGLGKGCNFFVFTGTSFAANSTPGCTNYAIGGAVINPAASGLSGADPRGLPVQYATATAAGNFAAGDLLLIDGGGNDAADLVGAYLAAGGGDIATYTTLLVTLLTADQINAALAGGAAGLAAIGNTYMTALGDRAYDLLKAGALDKGAQRVALLNAPDITLTPRFQMVLDSIAAANGGGDAGAAARAQAQALFSGWVASFNAQLATRVAGDSRIALVDFYTEFQNQVANPAQFGLTNVTTPACPITGIGSDGLPTYTFATCTNAALDADPPDGVSGAGWYDTWAFSDGFHPTPYGHQLLSQLISRSLAQAGWL
jgi:outer membrane lipase/esterase